MRDARPLLVLVVLVLGLLAPTNAAAETTLEKELDRPALDEFTVDGAPEVLVWSVNTKEHPLRSDSYVQFGDDRPIQMNRPGSRTSFVGTDGESAVFSVKRGGGDFDLKLFDLGSLTRSDPPRSVNTPAAENWPSISGRWLLFLRDDSNIAAPGQGRLRMILFNTVTGERRVLANEPAASSLLETGQVNGDWATWISCDEDYSTFTASDCQVYRYRISRDRIVQIPNPHKQQFGSMVTPDGTVYFTRNRNRHSWECGRGAHIVRYPVGGPAESIASVPSGFVVLWGRAVTERGGSITLHMYRIPCTFDPGGIYEIEHADSA